jgi:hypothetical protein
LVISFLRGSCGLRIRSVTMLIGWLEDILSSLKAYTLVTEFKHISGGGKAASTSIGSISIVLKTPRIFLIPRFWRFCIILLNCTCPFYYITDL